METPDKIIEGAATGPARKLIFGLTQWSGRRVFNAKRSRARSASLGLWGAQQLFSTAWTPLVFGRGRPGLALFDVAALWVALAGYIGVTWRVDRTASLAVVPVLGWVTFAAYLNAKIVRKKQSSWTSRFAKFGRRTSELLSY